jgi:hypothetical protein
LPGTSERGTSADTLYNSVGETESMLGESVCGATKMEKVLPLVWSF